MSGFGTLMIFDCVDCNHSINNRFDLELFIDTIVKIMDMKRIGNPTYEWFADNDYNRERDLIGYSVTQIISLSSITIHCCSLSRRMYIDVFTCCKVNDEIIKNIKEMIIELFKPRIINSNQINR